MSDGKVGTYTYGDQYGETTSVTLTDSDHIFYNNGQKKIYIHTPYGYDPDDADGYGVLYMFDGQSLFADYPTANAAPNCHRRGRREGSARRKTGS